MEMTRGWKAEKKVELVDIQIKVTEARQFGGLAVFPPIRPARTEPLITRAAGPLAAGLFEIGILSGYALDFDNAAAPTGFADVEAFFDAVARTDCVVQPGVGPGEELHLSSREIMGVGLAEEGRVCAPRRLSGGGGSRVKGRAHRRRSFLPPARRRLDAGARISAPL
jgi:hypothetical protein